MSQYTLQILNIKNNVVDKKTLAKSGKGSVMAQAGMQYQLIDQSTGKAPKKQVLKKKGQDLVIEVDGAQVGVIHGFYDESSGQNAPSYRLDDTCSLDDTQSLNESNQEGRYQLVVGGTAEGSAHALDDGIVWHEDSEKCIAPPVDALVAGALFGGISQAGMFALGFGAVALGGLIVGGATLNNGSDGDSGGSAPVTDTTPPDAPVGKFNNSDPANPVINGTGGEPGATITVTDPNGEIIGSAVVKPDGSWTVPLNPSDLGDGDQLTLTQTDPSGNVSPPGNVLVDLMPPDAPVGTIDNTDPTHPSINGTGGEPGATITVTDPDGEIIGSATVNPDGSWTVPLNPSDLGDGDQLTVTQTDPSGNVSPPLGLPFDLMPTIIIDPITADNNIDASEGAQSEIAITGTTTNTAAGDVVTLSINGNSYAGVVASDLTFTIYVATADLLADSDFTIGASVVSGSLTNTDTQIYTVNSAPAPTPTTTVSITGISLDTGTSGDFITSDNDGLTVNGSLSTALVTGEKLMYSRDNGATWIDITASVSGTGVSYFDGNLTSTNTVKFQVVDQADNLGSIASQLITIDTTAPTIIITIDSISLDTGTSGDFITSDTDGLTVNGTLSTALAAGEKLMYSNDNGVTWIDITASVSDTAISYADAALTSSTTIKLQVLDAAGNPSVTATQAITIDTTAPTTTVSITGISLDTGTSGDFITSDTDGLTVNGTLSTALAAGEKLMYSRDNGATWIDITASVSGTGVSYFDAALTSSTTIKLQVLDAAGNPSVTATQAITIDTTAPTTIITITGISLDTGTSGDFITSDNDGLTVNGSLSTALVTGEKLMYSRDNGATWIDITASVSGTGVSYFDAALTNSNTIQMRVIDAAGNPGSTASQLITIDTAAPGITVTIAGISLDSGMVGDFVTNDNNGLTINATLSTALAADEKLMYSRDNGATWIDITASVSGTGVSYFDAALTTSNRIKFQVVDQAGNLGPVASQLVTIDTTAPTTIVNITCISQDTGIPGNYITSDNDGLIINASLTTALASGEKLMYSNDNGATWIDITASVSGTGVSYFDGNLTSTNTVKFQVVDQAGNLGSIASQLITIDTTAPTTTIDITGISADTGALGDYVTNDNDGLIINGSLSTTLVMGERLMYSRDNGVTWIDITSSVSGTTVSHYNAALTSSTTIQMRVIDAAGNPGSSDSQAITIDTGVPTTTVNITGISLDTGIANDFITSDNNGLIINGSLSTALGAGEKLMYSRDNGVTWIDVTGSVSGTAISYADATLTTSNRVKFQVVDLAGNAGPIASQLITIDTTAPTTTVRITGISQDTGIAGNYITSDNDGLVVNATLSIALVEGERLMYSNDNGVTWIDITSTSVIGSVVSHFDANLTSTNTVKFQVVDQAGNLGSIASQLVTIDTIAPTTTVSITGISLDTGIAGDFITRDNDGLTINGTLSTALAFGESLMYSRDNGVTWIDITSSVSGTTVSHYDVDLTKSTNIQLQVIDAAGNAGSTTSKLITIDTSAPVITIATVAGDDVVNSSEKAAGVLVSGTTTAEAGQTVTVKWGNTTHTAIVSSTGSWSVAFAGSELPADGNTTITATVNDIAGNAAPPASRPVTISSVGIVIAIDALLGDNIMNAAERASIDAADNWVVTGTTTAATGSTVTLILNQKVYTGTVSAGGIWSINVIDTDVLALAHGNAYNIKATVTEVSGNTATGNGSLQVLIAPPDIPTVNLQNTNSYTPTLTGLAALNSGGTAIALATNDQFTVTVGGQSYTYIVGTTFSGPLSYNLANQTWTLVLPAGVITADGIYDVGVSVSAVGYATPKTDISSNELVISKSTPSLVLNAIAGDDIINATEIQGAITISGTVSDLVPGTSTNAAIGGTVTFTLDGRTYTAIVKSDGTWSALVPINAVAALTGTETVAATFTSIYNNSASANRDVVVDITAPTTMVSITGISLDTGTAGDFITSDNDGLTINGSLSTTLAAGEKLMYSRDNGATWINITSSVSGTGVSYFDANLTSTNTVKLQVIDQAGNLGSIASQLITIDAGAPATTISITGISLDTGITGDFITSDNDGLTVNASLSTNLASGEKLMYSRDNGVTWIDITSSVTGTAVSYADAALTSSNTIQLQVIGQTGNPGATASQLITIDTVAPTTTISITGISLDSGTVGDFVTNDNNGLTINATLSTALVAGESLMYSRDNGVTWIDITASVSGTGVSYFDAGLTSSNTTQFQVVDQAGNAGATASQAITIDASAPATTIIIDGISADTGTVGDFVTSDNDGLTINARLSAALVAGEKLMYSRDNGATWIDVTSSVSFTTVNYFDAALINTSTIKFQVLDQAGNAGPTASQLITIDPNAPTTNTIYGSSYDDTISGSQTKAEYMLGGEGNDLIYAGGGPTSPMISQRPDTIDGGNGNDTIYGQGYYDGAGTTYTIGDTFIGGAGNDWVDYSKANSGGYNIDNHGINADLATGRVIKAIQPSTGNALNPTYSAIDTIISGIENVVGTSSTDLLRGNGEDNILDGRSGNDSLDGRGGNDTLIGGLGNDTIFAQNSDGNDLMLGGDGIDVATYQYVNAPITLNMIGSNATVQSASSGIDIAEGVEWFIGSSLNDVMLGDRSNVIVGIGLENRFDGGLGNDSMDGGSGDDSLVGGLGSDTLMGGRGSDLIYGDQYNAAATDSAAAIDWVDYSDLTAGDSLILNLFSGRATVNSASEVDTLANIEAVMGGASNDSIAGSATSNTLLGGAGNDTLNGGGLGVNDHDWLDGGTGVDWVDYSTYDGGTAASTAVNVNLVTGIAIGMGTDTLISIENVKTGNGADTIIAQGNIGNYIVSGAGNDSVLADGVADDAVGSGNDTVLVGAGADVVWLGGGNDAFVIDSAYNADINADTIRGGDGFDAIVLQGGALTLDMTLARYGDANFESFERIDITGSGNNSIKLAAADIMELTDRSASLSTLILDGNAGDKATLNGIAAGDLASGTVFVDLNGDGIMDAGESFVVGAGGLVTGDFGNGSQTYVAYKNATWGTILIDSDISITGIV